ncbi:hypothetical protein O53_1924 [Microcystis aeruginosa TAIHU98]|uniref:Uncharacterized protein n=2 Tax=Microcystis aeruginosa TaxID=1126 RepID=L7EEK8_MICAE|nr:hypothetical protein BH695_3086 [Microcystis aeruginosa PCC 7806SL]ELP57311.1 hypothetical protein O53_1924 [Microcystis aeruginosa TAIHU98]ELS46399.1 hypothetical protein C789_3801 [Microcystis aeruginosa FACHB-905 = DIANCHI905]ODV37253.1 hypothetical protein BFG60_3153 [Microcystis aeruginosa NIES-98]
MRCYSSQKTGKLNKIWQQHRDQAIFGVAERFVNWTMALLGSV